MVNASSRRPIRTGVKTDDSRLAILKAAIAEFSELGPAGARTDSIARAAGVNKALLHYYYGSKDALYGAAFDEVFTGYLDRQMSVLRGPGSVGERVLSYFLTHFDHLAEHGSFARMVEYEMMRAREGSESRIPHLVKTCFAPLAAAIREAIIEGIRAGEFRRVDPANFFLSMTGVNVFYFISAPVMREIGGKDPRSPEMLQQRRLAIMDLAAAALFDDREHGQRVAKRVLAESEHKRKNTQRGKRP